MIIVLLHRQYNSLSINEEEQQQKPLNNNEFFVLKMFVPVKEFFVYININSYRANTPQSMPIPTFNGLLGGGVYLLLNYMHWFNV